MPGSLSSLDEAVSCGLSYAAKMTVYMACLLFSRASGGTLSILGEKDSRKSDSRYSLPLFQG